MDVRKLGSVALVSLCMMGGALFLSGASAFAARGHVFGGAFGKAGAGDGEFSSPAGVAVNEANGGDVYVVDRGNNRVEYFTPTGAYVGKFDGSGTDLAVEGKAAPTGRFSTPESIVVDNDAASPSFGDVYVADTGHEVIDKFSATGAYIGQLTETSGGSGFGQIDGVAVDENGGLWVYQGNDQIDAFNGDLSNEFLSSVEANFFGGGEPGFAVDSNNYFYVKGYFLGISKLNSSGQVVIEEVDSLIHEPASSTVPGEVAVDLSSNDVYIDDADGANAVGRFTSSGSLIESFGSEHLNKGSGVAVNATTGVVYVADSSGDVIDVFLLEPPAAPKLEDESILNVASSSATFFGRIDPRGPATEYRFEYGTTTSYGDSLPLPDASVGSGFDSQAVSTHAQDLSPDTVYHFRVVAHNELGEVDSEDRTFTTQPLGGELRLPDGRVWEMVSPPQKQGADIDPIGEYPLQAAADGGAITYNASAPTELEPPGNGNGTVAGNDGARVFSWHSPSGWSSSEISLPNKEAVPITLGHGEAYKLFSTDLAYGLVEPVGNNLQSPEATERTDYLRSDYAKGEMREPCVSSCYRPLVTASNVPPGTMFGGTAQESFPAAEFFGATPDLSHVLLRSSVALTSTPGKYQLYEWSGGQLQLVSVLPKSEGGGPAQGEVAKNGNSMHVISDGGGRVFWWLPRGNLYTRDTVTQETARLDVVEGNQTNTEAHAPLFQTASSDGSRAFFIDAERLTEDSTARDAYPGEPDLYAYDVNAPIGKRLTDLTVDQNPGEAANLLGVQGASEDGSYVYFVADGALAAGATAGGCSSGSLSVCNLYVVHNIGSEWERPKLVAVLSGEDRQDWGSGRSLTARVSPDGRYLAFMSDRSLTGYDNRDAVSGKPDEEVYLYDADTHKVICTSCNPTGARPTGVEYGSQGRSVGGDRVWETTTWLAANVPGWTGFNLVEADYQSRYLSDSGRLFFNSSDALVPQDVNGTEDVYEYEPAGIGDCAISTTTFSARLGGCVSLISSGASPEESAFLDASETGGDVFFMTAAKLVSQDFDTAYDVYDAHKCTSQVPCMVSPVSLPPCSTSDSCKAAPTPQPAGLGAPSSATFSGAGNVLAQPSTPASTTRSLSRAQKFSRALKACAKKRSHKKRTACERIARKRYGKAAARRAKRPAAGHKTSVLTWR